MRTLKIFLVFLTLSINLHGQWEWQNGFPPRQNMLKIRFINADTLFAVGVRGLVIRSTDKGVSWEQQTTNTELTLNDITFANNDLGFIIGDSGLLLKTSDTGNKWVEQYTTGIGGNLRAICNVGTNNLWICGGYGLIMHSSDSGESWEVQNSNVTTLLTDIHFSNQYDGCAVGSNGFTLNTSDGGVNWEKVQYDGNFKAIDFINDEVGYSVSTRLTYPLNWDMSIIWKTTNKGKTWNFVKTIDLLSFQDIIFISEQAGFAVGYGSAAGAKYGVISKTSTGGSSWTQVLEAEYGVLNSGTSATFNHWVSVSDKGFIYATTDQGTNWKLLFEDKFYGYLRAVDFVDKSNGWTVGHSSIGQQGFSVLLKTSDGGQHWIEKLRSIDKPVSHVFFVNSNIGWIGGSDGLLYKSFDSGENWIDKSLAGAYISDIFFINEENGWIVQGRNLKKTTNGGDSWIIQKEFPQDIIYKFFFIDDLYGWLTVKEYNLGKIFRTTNGGDDWIESSDSSLYGMNEVFFIDRYKGWAVSAGSELWFTSNGGVDWEVIYINTEEQLSSIVFFDSLTGFACGSDGLIINTTDGGVTWEKSISVTSENLNHIDFINREYGWIVGNGGVILKTTNGGLTFVQDEKSVTTYKYHLLQNYPNPFNPSTIISYSVPVPGKVRLTVYDALGREVRKLVYEEKDAGKYEVEFNASGLASGMYFYVLKASGFTVTKKMMILK